MQGKKDQGGPIRKGPWKAEEDEVLLTHVNKYGPRDWSSIRSKGLLQRTGKSCRLRWVNKLRPNLKNGCKFTAEEERVVIELQAQYGNKWAKIALHLPGRTDNDVKNFWSSRQKRLARILQTSPSTTTPCSSTKSHKKNKNISIKVPTFHHLVPALEAPKFSSSSEEESSLKAHQSCSSISLIENSAAIKMVPLPDPMNSKPLNSYTNMVKQEFTTPFESYASTDLSSEIAFPQVFPFSMEGQDLLDRTSEPSNFIDGFGSLDIASELGIGAQIPIGLPFFEPSGNCNIGTRDSIGNPTNPDSFFDDFPEDMFDDMQPPPSPSEL
ncbi:transcription factor DUO1 [Senna tora]|uniref:Transcription factor DUO1 n=1 Tax=Senna tora TaxID=362788 RepID=A0A834TQB2_9FABA|nr:transcription factor DUO1 [Senna tora]